MEVGSINVALNASNVQRNSLLTTFGLVDQNFTAKYVWTKLHLRKVQKSIQTPAKLLPPMRRVVHGKLRYLDIWLKDYSTLDFSTQTVQRGLFNPNYSSGPISFNP